MTLALLLKSITLGRKKGMAHRYGPPFNLDNTIKLLLSFWRRENWERSTHFTMRKLNYSLFLTLIVILHTLSYSPLMYLFKALRSSTATKFLESLYHLRLCTIIPELEQALML